MGIFSEPKLRGVTDVELNNQRIVLNGTDIGHMDPIMVLEVYTGSNLNQNLSTETPDKTLELSNYSSQEKAIIASLASVVDESHITTALVERVQRELQD